MKKLKTKPLPKLTSIFGDVGGRAVSSWHGLLIVPLCLFLLSFIVGFALIQNHDEHTSSQREINEKNRIPKEQLINLELQEHGECENEFLVKVPEHSRSKGLQDMCTHGPDLLEDSGGVMGSVVEQDSNTVQCYGDGSSGRRVQAVYAVSEDRPDRYEELLPAFRAWAAHMDSIVDRSAQKTGGSSRIKWVTNADCQIEVEKVLMTATGDDSYGDTVAQLRESGYTDSTRKYLIWTDASLYCGLGTIDFDDRADPSLNKNNTTRFPDYSRVDTPCWGRYRSTELHELFHNIGAVQRTAPHGRSGHCTDGYDLLCTSLGFTEVCPVDQVALLDCNNDDYFHASPSEGNYLHDHWNTYNSGFLYSSIPDDTEPPSLPQNLRAEETEVGVVLQWEPSEDDQSEITYKIYRERFQQETYSLYDTSSDSQYTDFYVQNGLDYRYYVVAVDESGNESERSTHVYIEITGDPDSPPDTTPPLPVVGLHASDITTTGFSLGWSIPDPGDVFKIDILLNGSITASYTDDRTATSVCCSLSAGSTYTVQIDTYDVSFN